MSPERLRARELTPRGKGAISVLEVAGSGALARVREVARAQGLAPGGFAHVRLRRVGDGELLDEALVVSDSEERVELHLHGSPAVVQSVLSELGAELSTGSARSLEERAEELLAGAASEAAARMLLDQVGGALRTELEALARLSGAERRTRIEELVARARAARWLVTPPRVVLAGPVNAGKSTLFNALVGEERVVVDPREGTTRDAVEERVLLGEYAVDLVDTAGERELSGEDPASQVERAGQELAARVRAGADLVLLLSPLGSEARLPRHGAGRLVRRVHTYAELDRGTGGTSSSVPAISVPTRPGEARRVIVEILHEALALPSAPWQAGRAVPFERAWLARLEDALHETDEDALRESLRAWLDPAPR